MRERDLREQLAKSLRDELATGFVEAEEALRFALMRSVGEAVSAEVEETGREALGVALAAREAEMAGWPGVTDCDRLDAAFEELNAMGIMARHHWWCCDNCGQGAMPGEMKAIAGQWNGVPIVGYAFYHVQDTQCAVNSGEIYLSYGKVGQFDSWEAYGVEAAGVGQTVCRVIERHGLRADWNGSTDHRLRVSLDWKRRARPPRFCEGDNDAKG